MLAHVLLIATCLYVVVTAANYKESNRKKHCMYNNITFTTVKKDQQCPVFVGFSKDYNKYKKEE